MMKSLEHRIPPPLVALMIGGGMWLISRYTEHAIWPRAMRWGLIAALLGVGVGIGGAGFRAFARARTTINPVRLESASVLVTTGVFRLSRNPMYVGFAALLTAWAIWLQAPWALPGVGLFVAFIWRFQIVPEERVLTVKFGSSYGEYRNRVRRWL
jgi:protein-S-isoprenylcysteine O-methyltransferase Ste14